MDPQSMAGERSRPRARGAGRGTRTAVLIAVIFGAYHVGMELRYQATGRASLHQRLELTAFDVKLAARGPRPPKTWKVAIAAADEKSLARFGPLPWSRRLHAALVEALGRDGARAIAFDMTFERPSLPEGPELLREKLLEAGLLNGLADRLEARTDAVAELRAAERRRRRFELARPPVRQLEVEALRAVRAIRRVASKVEEHNVPPDEAFARALKENGRAVLGVVALSAVEARSLGAKTEQLSESLRAVQPSLVTGLTETQGPIEILHPSAGAFARGAYRRYFGLAAPTSTLARASNYFGALNATPDDDGVNRALPVVVSFREQDVLLPSLALAAVAAAEDVPVEVLGHPEDPAAYAVRVGPHVVELGLSGQVLVDWYGGFSEAELPRYSIADLLDGTVPQEDIRGRIVFVAATAIGTHDQRVTPLERAVPGVYIHATLAQNLLDGRHLTRPPWVIALELGVILLVGLLTGGALARLGFFARLVAGLAIVAGWVLADQLLLFEQGLVVHTLLPIGQVFVTLLVLSVQGFLREQRERQRTRIAFGRYLSPRVMEQVLSDPEQHLRLGGKRHQATVLFSDIRGFTSISERLDPEQLGHMLNLYMTPMTRIVFEHEGTLDKYIGDAVMAFWGAPIPQDDHARRACRAALQMLQELDRVNEVFEKEGLPRISIGIGLSAGEMTVGNMGSDDFFAYTAIGDRVNLGARLEGQTKTYGVDIIISHDTYRAVQEEMLCRELDLLRVKGKREPERIYELIGLRQVSGHRLLFVEVFEAGLKAFRDRRFDEARVFFEEARDLGNDDRCSQQYAELSQHLSVHPPPPDWDGVREATSK